VILNGLGATKYEELFLLWRHVEPLLRELSLEIIDPEVGELVTSLDMTGLSLTLVLLDAELEKFWVASADTPAYKKGTVLPTGVHSRRALRTLDRREAANLDEASEASKSHAATVTGMLGVMVEVLRSAEDELGRIDAVAGDGDHGRGMVKGASAGHEAATAAVEDGAGVEHTLKAAGDAWAAKAGGTSGALWGAALRRVGEAIGDRFDGISAATVSDAISAGFDAIQTLGMASLGDKTMLDALGPFEQVLAAEISRGTDLGIAWERAANAATKGSEATAALTPKIGRARPLAARSVGTVDAGATSMALVLSALAVFFPPKNRKD
jgi:dihydroxyacetone kinase